MVYTTKQREVLFELLAVIVSVLAAEALSMMVEALKERRERRKKAPRKPGKHFRKEP